MEIPWYKCGCAWSQLLQRDRLFSPVITYKIPFLPPRPKDFLISLKVFKGWRLVI